MDASFFIDSALNQIDYLDAHIRGEGPLPPPIVNKEVQRLRQAKVELMSGIGNAFRVTPTTEWLYHD